MTENLTPANLIPASAITMDQELCQLRQQVADLEAQLQAYQQHRPPTHAAHGCLFQEKKKVACPVQQQVHATQLIDEITFKRLVEESNDVIWVANLDGTIAYLSPAFDTFFGRSREDWIGQPFLPLVHPEDLEYTQAIIQQVIQTGQSCSNYDVRNLGQDGAILWCHASVAAVKNAVGEVIGLQGSLRNIGELKHLEAQNKSVEAEFRQQDLLYRRIFETVQEGLTIIDLNTGVVLEANPSCCAMHGRSYEEMIGLMAQEFIHPDSLPLFQQFAEALHRGEKYHTEALDLRKDGTVFDVEVTGVSIWYEGRYCALSIVRDISDRKRAEQQLEAQAQREHLLNRLTNKIRNTLDFNNILETTLKEIWQLVQADRCSFSWYYADEEAPYLDTIKQTHAESIPNSLGRHSAKHLSAISNYVMMQKVLEIVDADQVKDQTLQKIMKQWGMRSLLAIPMETRSGMIGVITCEHLTQPRDWIEDEIELLQAVMEQFAIAINQSDLYTQARIQAYELEQTLQELKQTQTQMVQAEKMSSLGQLVAGVAHEINNPVNFIHGNINPALEYTQDLLQVIALYQQHYPQPVAAIAKVMEEMDLEFVAEDLKKLLRSMKVGTERIREIVLSLRNFSRLDEADMKAVNIHDGIDSTLMILQ
ncbi:MAG: PAS domain S-box protein, partial [Synechococcales bacterium]|nr:PAS domain S-box protein [Synechococcales bacterium]